MGKGTGFGKTIFIGDQFVLEEVPAIVAALPFSTVCEVERIDGEGWVLEDNRIEVPGYKEKKKEQQVESIDHVLEVMNIDVKKTPLKIIYGGDLLAGSGVGASAAHCVSMGRAINDEFDLGYSIEQINHVGWEGEFAYHGVPSGVDNTASTYGGILKYWVKDGEKHFEQLKLKAPVEGVLAASGITANTAALGGVTAAERARHPALFDYRMKVITEQSNALKEALEAGDFEQVGAIMTANHETLIAMGLSHEKLVDLCDLALQNGAFGAKLTGGGRGGYMFALTPGKELQEEVASAIEKEGYQVIRSVYGAV